MSNDTAERARGSLSATGNVLYIMLNDFPGEPFQVDYALDESGQVSGQLTGETIVTVQGRTAEPGLLGLAIEIRTPQRRASYQLKARP